MSNNYVDFQNALAIALASGMGGEGEMMVAETLWEGEKHSINDEILIKYSQYDLLVIGMCPNGSEEKRASNNILLVSKIDPNISYIQTCATATGTVAIRYKFGDNKLVLTHVQGNSVTGWYNPSLREIIGIKFTGTKSIDYTENEQVVGRWKIEGDNKLIYQKTIVTTPVNGRASIPLTLISDNIKMVVNTNIMLVSDDFCYPVPSANDTLGAQTYYEIKKNPTLYYIDMWIGNLLYNRYSKCYITLQYTKTTD